MSLFHRLILLAALVALPCPALLRAADDSEHQPAAIVTTDPRTPASDEELRFWLENMVWHHRYTTEEMRAATGLSKDDLQAAQTRFNVFQTTKPARDNQNELLVLPYPGGRHPRIGFRDGAITPQRETKVSIFAPWSGGDYVVADVPEAIWSNLGLTYLAHTHIETIWTKQNVELEKLEWQRRDDGTLFMERRLPNGITFSTRVIPDRGIVWFDQSLTNGTQETLNDLRVQNCVMLARARGFEEQTNDNKIIHSPYIAAHNKDRTRWIVTSFSPVHRPWANPPCPCIHSDPKFPDCPPGATRHVRGLITLFESRVGQDELLATLYKSLDALDWRQTAHSTESADQARDRHDKVAKRRAGLAIICHRGAHEFAHENTIEAYRATFELGADGNEIDVRMTKDGMLVCFHDDMLDRLVELYGDVSDVTWPQLRGARFRNPGWLGGDCRIPTLVEVFELHRQHAGLIHLDLKQAGMDTKILQLLDEMDLWDHVMSAPAELGAAIVNDPRFKPLKYKTQVYSDDRDVDPLEIAKAMKLDGSALIVDDPRAAIVAFGRKLGAPSTRPVKSADEASLLRSDYSLPRQLGEGMQWNATRILHAVGRGGLQAADTRTRSAMADHIRHVGAKSYDAVAALENAVRSRTVHDDWRLHALDGEAALRALIALKVPEAVDVARECLWRVDERLAAVQDKRFAQPASWHDWRLKTNVFEQLQTLPGESTEKLCRDYLALRDAGANKLGPPQFAPAAQCLLVIKKDEATAVELLNDSRPAVRNRAVKVCLRHAHEDWARAALEKAVPHALKYIVANNSDSAK
jgi:hypothetical protein